MAARLSIVSLASAFRANNNNVLSRVVIVSGRRGIQGSSHQDQAASDAADKVKHGANEAMKSGENIKNNAASAAQNISEKAKETMGGSWGNAKETAEKTKESVKSQAAKVEKCMNTKKEVS